MLIKDVKENYVNAKENQSEDWGCGGWKSGSFRCEA